MFFNDILNIVSQRKEVLENNKWHIFNIEDNDFSTIVLNMVENKASVQNIKLIKDEILKNEEEQIYHDLIDESKTEIYDMLSQVVTENFNGVTIYSSPDEVEMIETYRNNNISTDYPLLDKYDMLVKFY